MPIIICLSDKCTSANKNSSKPCIEPTVTYTGAVLETWEVNGSDDSDFIAAVWDAEESRIREVDYASTRGWTYHNRAIIDATEASIKAARQWATERWVERFTMAAQRQAESVMVKGRTVRSLTTRGKNVGVSGVVMWHGEDAYRSSRWLTEYRVGLKVEGEAKLRYLPADRVEVIDPEPIDPTDIRQEAFLAAHERSFRSVLDPRGYLI